MTTDNLPLRPSPKPETELDGFWAATAEGHLALGKCPACDLVFFPPQRVCPGCWSSPTVLTNSSGRGVVETFSVIHRAGHPAFKARLPYVAALIRLEEGVAVTASVVDIEPDDVHIGLPVRAIFEETADGISIPLFEREEK